MGARCPARWNLTTCGFAWLDAAQLVYLPRVFCGAIGPSFTSARRFHLVWNKNTAWKKNVTAFSIKQCNCSSSAGLNTAQILIVVFTLLCRIIITLHRINIAPRTVALSGVKYHAKLLGACPGLEGVLIRTISYCGNKCRTMARFMCDSHPHLKYMFSMSGMYYIQSKVSSSMFC